jgi:hypothetical protein
MREFTKLSPTIWTSKVFQALTVRERNQFLYLLAGPNQTSAGCCRVPESYACGDLGCKPIDYRNINVRLQDVQLIEFDTETSEVLITGWFKDNPPMNDKHRKGTQKEIDRIQSDQLRSASQAAFDEAWAKYVARQDAKARKDAGYDLNRSRSRTF